MEAREKQQQKTGRENTTSPPPAAVVLARTIREPHVRFCLAFFLRFWADGNIPVSQQQQQQAVVLLVGDIFRPEHAVRGSASHGKQAAAHRSMQGAYLSPRQDCNMLPEAIAWREKKNGAHSVKISGYFSDTGGGTEGGTYNDALAFSTGLIGGYLARADCGLEHTAASSASQPRQASAGSIFEQTQQIISLVYPLSAQLDVEAGSRFSKICLLHIARVPDVPGISSSVPDTAVICLFPGMASSRSWDRAKLELKVYDIDVLAARGACPSLLPGTAAVRCC